MMDSWALTHKSPLGTWKEFCFELIFLNTKILIGKLKFDSFQKLILGAVNRILICRCPCYGRFYSCCFVFALTWIPASASASAVVNVSGCSFFHSSSVLMLLVSLLMLKNPQLHGSLFLLASMILLVFRSCRGGRYCRDCCPPQYFAGVFVLASLLLMPNCC